MAVAVDGVGGGGATGCPIAKRLNGVAIRLALWAVSSVMGQAYCFCTFCICRDYGLNDAWLVAKSEPGRDVVRL